MKQLLIVSTFCSTYPKYIETYRLLGKAYLEGQQHKEAIDVFQRVLTVAPDDFITHVGMSIIREDEGNLGCCHLAYGTCF